MYFNFSPLICSKSTECILNNGKNQRRSPSTISRDAFTFIFRTVVYLPALRTILLMNVLKLLAYVYKSVFFFRNLLPENIVLCSGHLEKYNLVVK